MKIQFFALILLSLSFLSCKKEEKKADLLHLLTSKPWKPSMTDKNPGSGPASSENLYYVLGNCDQGKLYKFGNNQLTIESSGNNCFLYPQDLQILNYQINFATKKITIDGFTYELAEISETQLKYYINLSPDSGNPEYTIYIFEH